MSAVDRAAFTSSKQFLKGAQVIQGGAVTAMLDFAMTGASSTSLIVG